MGIKHVECPQYRRFAKDGKIASLSLVFATGYLGNPASYYGHLLLKINDHEENRNALEDLAVNYGAKIPDNENMLVYMSKGLIGEYRSTFSPKTFYFYQHKYNDEEMRDLWEYEIKLDESGYELVVAHLWELLGVEHKYYF